MMGIRVCGIRRNMVLYSYLGEPMRKIFPLFSFVVTIALVACSTPTSNSTTDDDDDIFSSSGKGKSSSSKKMDSEDLADEIGEDCVGEPGKPWDGTTAKDFACGSGTKLNPYIILTAEQLAHLSFVVGAKDENYLDKYYKLGADITLNDGEVIGKNGGLVADSTKLHKWTPIGNSSIAFAGNFDGAGHTVSGLFINTTSTHNGLFGNSSGTVQNLTVENGWVMGGKYTAGIVGFSVGTISKLLNNISVSGSEDCVGGVVGNTSQKQHRYNSVMKNVKNTGIVVGKNNVGGIAGCATYVTVDGAENFSQVEGFGLVGGIFGGIGVTRDNDVQNLKNSGDVYGSHFVGGIAGHCGGLLSVGGSNSSSYNCYESYACGVLKNAQNVASITGKRFVGGIFGMANGVEMTAASNSAGVSGDYGVGGIASSVCYSTTEALYNVGDISGSGYVGGIFGYQKEGVTSSAYSTGKVDGDSLVGLMIGYNYNTTMADYYYLKQGGQEPFGLNNGGGAAIPKSAKEMKSQDFAELLGDDFVYDSKMNDGYPVLEWEKD